VTPAASRTATVSPPPATLAMLLDPGEEVAHGPVIGHARGVVADLSGKEFHEASRRVLAGVGDHRRHGDGARCCGDCSDATIVSVVA
jgi:hypothetical protein